MPERRTFIKGGLSSPVGDISVFDPEVLSKQMAGNILTGLGLVDDPHKNEVDLLGFTKQTYPEYVPDEMHRLIASHLDAVIEGKINKLMIFAPPQHGKSELVSVRLPAYWLGKRPDDPVMITSYGATLAEAKSRDIRQIIEESDTYHRLFPDVRIRYDSRSVHQWRIKGHRGGLIAAGVGGPITGHGAKLAICDDPFASWAEAQSPTIRESVHEWWKGTFRTRIREGGAIVLIMTRWHKDDIAGRLLADHGADWTVLRIPAIAENQEDRDSAHKFMGLPEGQPDALNRQVGEAAAPRRYSIPTLMSLKKDVGSVAWAAEYQQSPRDMEGNRFKKHWFQIVPNAPARCRLVRYWDKAGTEKDGAKFTAGVLVGYSVTGLVYIINVVKGRWSAGSREVVIKQTAQLDAQLYGMRFKIGIEQEPGSGGKESAENTIKNLAGYPVFAERPTGDKDTRLEPFAAQAEAGNVFLVEGAWNADYIEELLSIPNGTYRDQSDATAGAFNTLALVKRTVHGRKVATVATRKIERPQPFQISAAMPSPASGDLYDRRPSMFKIPGGGNFQ